MNLIDQTDAELVRERDRLRNRMAYCRTHGINDSDELKALLDVEAVIAARDGHDRHRYELRREAQREEGIEW